MKLTAKTSPDGMNFQYAVEVTVLHYWFQRESRHAVKTENLDRLLLELNEPGTRLAIKKETGELFTATEFNPPLFIYGHAYVESLTTEAGQIWPAPAPAYDPANETPIFKKALDFIFTLNNRALNKVSTTKNQIL